MVHRGLIALFGLLGLAPAAPRHEIGAGWMGYWFDYREELVAPSKSTERGLLPGNLLSYRYHPEKSPVHFDLLLEYTRMRTIYDGSTLDTPTTPVITKTNNTFLTLEGRVGHRIGVGKSHVFAGLGRRRWDRRLGAFNELYTWYFLGLGLRIVHPVTRKFSLEMELEARIMFAGAMALYLDNPGSDLGTAGLGSRHGGRALLPLHYTFSTGHGIWLSPFYEYSAIEESDPFPVSGLHFPYAVEPSSKTHQAGVQMGVQIVF